MEPELSSIFWVKIVAKNVVLGSPGTRFMHMMVKKHTSWEKEHKYCDGVVKEIIECTGNASIIIASSNRSVLPSIF